MWQIFNGIQVTVGHLSRTISSELLNRLEESKGEAKKLEHAVKLKDKKIEGLERRYATINFPCYIHIRLIYPEG